MGQNNILRFLSILIIFTSLSACQHSWVEERNIYLEAIEFGSNISESFKLKSKKYFIEDSKNHNQILKIQELKLKKKNFYGGPSARPKQIEIIAVLKFQLVDDDAIKSGAVSASGWLPINEQNPQAEILAQKQLTKELEFLILEELIQEYWLIEN
jgi:hypothetical protein